MGLRDWSILRVFGAGVSGSRLAAPDVAGAEAACLRFGLVFPQACLSQLREEVVLWGKGWSTVTM